MRVAWFPKTADLAGNPYWPCLQQELEGLGVEFESSHNSYWTQRRWLLEHRRSVQALHFHFIQPHYAGAGARASARRLGKFTSDLLLARTLGYKIVWTVHDLLPTWPLRPAWVEYAARLVMARLADQVIVHCAKAARLVREKFLRRSRMSVLPHPSFAEQYPNTITRAEARQRLGFTDGQFVVGFFGGIRPNKGIEQLIGAFGRLEREDAALLIAGRPWPPAEYVREICQQAARDARVHVEAREIANDEVQVVLKAADVLAFPFNQILTSSSVMLAMSFGCPVIVPRLGCLPELVTPEVGFVYEAGDVGGMAAALQQAATADLSALGAAAQARAGQYTWHGMALGTLHAYGAV